MNIAREIKVCMRKGCDVLLQKIDDDYSNYRVEFAGNGHYFKNLNEALEYLKKRKFIFTNKGLNELNYKLLEVQNGL